MNRIDLRPARLYLSGGNTVIAIPRAHCRALGLLPRMAVRICLVDDHLIITKYPEDAPHGRTPIRRPPDRKDP